MCIRDRPGSGKTEAAKQVARLLDRTLYCVDFENLIDSKLDVYKRQSLLFRLPTELTPRQIETLSSLRLTSSQLRLTELLRQLSSTSHTS